MSGGAVCRLVILPVEAPVVRWLSGRGPVGVLAAAISRLIVALLTSVNHSSPSQLSAVKKQYIIDTIAQSNFAR